MAYSVWDADEKRPTGWLKEAVFGGLSYFNTNFISGPQYFDFLSIALYLK